MKFCSLKQTLRTFKKLATNKILSSLTKTKTRKSINNSRSRIRKNIVTNTSTTLMNIFYLIRILTIFSVIIHTVFSIENSESKSWNTWNVTLDNTSTTL